MEPNDKEIYELQDLELVEISVVDEGANLDKSGDGAHVVLFKHKEQSKMDEKLVEETLVDRFVDKVSEVFSRAEEEVEQDNSAVDELRKQVEDINKANEDLAKAVSVLTEERDEAIAKAAEAEEARKLAEYTETAEEQFGNLPGEKEEKGKLWKKLSESLEEEELELLVKMLKSGDSVIEKELEPVGSDGVPEELSAAEEIEKLAQEKVEADPTLTLPKARAAVYKERPDLVIELRK